MSIDKRLAVLEDRLRAAEDRLEIMGLLNLYGPLVDSGEGQAAARLWVEDGVYDGFRRAVGHDDLAATYDLDSHKNLVAIGMSHFTATPTITVIGDEAQAVGYSFVIIREGERWIVVRASINHWSFSRTPQGWRIVERYNRMLDGSDDSLATMRRILPDGAVSQMPGPRASREGEEMTVEERLALLEDRLHKAEDHLEIINLVNTFGPLIDSGEGARAAHLWVEGGVYDMGAVRRGIAFEDMASIWVSESHKQYVQNGMSHLTAVPRITVDGDSAEAVGYSYVIMREDDRWFIARGSINHWTLTRTQEGWRIVERYNRLLDGSAESLETMRRIMT